MSELDENVLEIENLPTTKDKETKLSENAETEDTKIVKHETEETERTGHTKRKDTFFQDKLAYAVNSTPWRTYMMSLTDKHRILNRRDKLKERISDKLPQFPGLMTSVDFPLQLESFSLNNFNQQKKVNPFNKLKSNDNNIRIWRKMCSDLEVDTFNCLPQLRSLKTRENIGVKKLPCCLEVVNLSENNVESNYYSDQRELGYARIPPVCSKSTKYFLVDRAVGGNSGLVNGDYLMLELVSIKKEKIVNADVCLRGFKGMHITELSPQRAREKTWKFCFYQAVTALLAKTQLRYKYAWSGNIDYIYEHAWMLFIHMGFINVKRKQRLNDVVVYNYNYNIELELVDEFKDICRITDVAWNIVEETIKSEQLMKRKEFMHIPGMMGLKKNATLQKLSLHNTTKQMEEWFDKLDLQDTNCIIRTSIFCLAFWKDGLFWYLYNPFRCNEFGFWDDYGYNCIMKFCSRDSLKRYLMILLLRAYTRESNFKMKKNDTDKDIDINEEGREDEKYIGSSEDKAVKQSELKSKNDVFTIQIFKMIYHCCKIHNTKSCQKKVPSKSKVQIITKKELNDECAEYIIELKNSCMTEEEKIEKLNWLKTVTITWSQISNVNQDEEKKKKFMWHQYYVEEKGKLFSLWAHVHITDNIFPQSNRGKQFYACYVICAGMTRLMAPEYWTSQTLNAILICGDSYYTSSIVEAKAKFQTMELLNNECLTNYLSEEFKIGSFLFQVKILPAISGQLYNKYDTCLWSAIERCFSKYHFAILTCENACLGVFKHRDAYYVFDVHSVGPPIFQYGKGTAYLLRAAYFHKFIISLILTIGSPECSQFALNPIDILKILQLDNIACPKKSYEKEIYKDMELKSKCQVNKNKK